MEAWNQDGQPKRADEIIVQLFEQIAEANLRFATGDMQHDEWTADMRDIDQKLSIFGLRLDRPERFAAKPSGRL